jgi:hypothetical protein
VLNSRDDVEDETGLEVTSIITVEDLEDEEMIEEPEEGIRSDFP